MDKRHSPIAPQASAGKARIDAGQRLPGGYNTRRPFFCRSCGKERVGTTVPRGWYSLARHTERTDRPVVRLGLYCSVTCLDDQMNRLIGIDAEMEDRFDQSASYQHERDTAKFPVRY